MKERLAKPSIPEVPKVVKEVISESLPKTTIITKPKEPAKKKPRAKKKVIPKKEPIAEEIIENQNGLYIEFEQLKNVKPYTMLRFITEVLGHSGGSGKKKRTLKTEIEKDVRAMTEKALEELKKL